MIIIASGLLDTIVQSSGGTTVQNGYGGLQLHKKAYQRKVKSFAQQAQRNNFTVAQTGWRNLTTEQQESWYAAAVPPQSGFELYSQTNNVLVAAGEEIIPAYVMPVTPVIINTAFTGSTFAQEDDGNHLTIITTNSGDTIPQGDWIPYILYSGWIGPNVFRFPPTTLKITNDIVGTSGVLLEITIQPAVVPNLQPPGEFWKARFQFNALNTVTGQIGVGNSLDIIATTA